MTGTSLEPVHILRGRTKRLGLPFSYKLAGGAAYGMDIAFPDQAEYDESRMSLWIPFADGNRRDGVGDILRVEGIDTARHRLNPIVLFDHGKQVPLPIALAEDRDSKEYTVRIDQTAQTAKLNAFFYQGTGFRGVEKAKEYDHALFCEQLYDMGVKRLVRGGSIGYQVLDASELPPDYQRGTPKGLDLRRVLMLEGSLVVLPANMDTVGKMLDPHFRCCGKALSRLLVKSLEPYAKGYEGNFLESREDYDNPLSRGNVPAPNWRAGQGAKSRRVPTTAYDTSAEKRRISPHAPVAKPTQLRTAASKPGRQETSTAKPPKGVPESQWQPEGRDIPRSETPEIEHQKRIKELRLKYRRGAGHRRVVRRGSPGRSIVHCRSKDLDELRKHASDRGLQATWLGTVGAQEKVRLVGDEFAIGEIARRFGRPVRRGKKSLEPYPRGTVRVGDPDDGPPHYEEVPKKVKRDVGGGIPPHQHEDYQEKPAKISFSPPPPEEPPLPKLPSHGEDELPHTDWAAHYVSESRRRGEVPKPKNPKVKPGRLAESREESTEVNPKLGYKLPPPGSVDFSQPEENWSSEKQPLAPQQLVNALQQWTVENSQEVIPPNVLAKLARTVLGNKRVDEQTLIGFLVDQGWIEGFDTPDGYFWRVNPGEEQLEPSAPGKPVEAAPSRFGHLQEETTRSEGLIADLGPPMGVPKEVTDAVIQGIRESPEADSGALRHTIREIFDSAGTPKARLWLNRLKNRFGNIPGVQQWVDTVLAKMGGG